MTAGRRLLIGIDCATSHLALALVDPAEGTVAAASEDVGRAHAAMLLEALEALMRRGGADRHEVALIGVGIGPGSYTGVRVGVATAAGLARALGVPARGVSSLVAVPAGLALPGTEVVSVSDARRGNVYAQRLRRLRAEPWVVAYEELEGPRKLGRAELGADYPGVRVVELGAAARGTAGAPPDAAAVAWAAHLAGHGADGTLRPLYL